MGSGGDAPSGYMSGLWPLVGEGVLPRGLRPRLVYVGPLALRLWVSAVSLSGWVGWIPERWVGCILETGSVPPRLRGKVVRARKGKHALGRIGSQCS
jgi:hypothetical protein